MKGRLGSLVVLLLFASGTVWGAVTASISGTVTDSTGAVIPKVSVVVLNTQTGVTNSTQTNAAGFYSFPALPTGHYEVKITASGFEEYQQTGIVLDVNNALRVDATLNVGSVTQQVSVSSTVVHVETSNTQMGEVIVGSKMTALPLNGRAYTDLLALQPGVAPATSGQGGGYSVSGDLNNGQLSVSGQRESSNGYIVNGGTTEEQIFNATAVIPNLDSIAEFRILTNNADAEYGTYAGALVNVITKSGTNQYHGDAFEFLRNPNYDSRNFYSPDRAVLHQNQFGGTLGGPIRHDKLFFFTDFQGTRMVTGVDTGLIAVPSAAEKTGDLSGVTNKLSGTVNGGSWANTLSQELGYPVTNGENYYTSGCTSSSQCVFPNAIVPPSVFTAPTKALMPYIVNPNLGSYYSTSAYDETLGDNKGSARIDANTHLGMVSGYYFIDDNLDVDPYKATGKDLPGFSLSNNGRAQMLNLGITKSFGPSSVNELRLHWMRNTVFVRKPVGGLGPSLASQGFTGIVTQDVPDEGVEWSNFKNFRIGASNSILHVFENTPEVADNFSKVMGTHTLKFGGNFSYSQAQYDLIYFPNGGYWFSNNSETGLDFADFLIGAPSQFYQNDSVPAWSRSRYFGLYAEDSWRARPNLTVNVGLRWEVSSPWWEAHNQQETEEFGMQSKTFPGAPVGYLVAGDPGVPSTLAPTRYNNFAPRVGLAYSPSAQTGFLGKLLGGTGKTSIRTGFGIYYTNFENRTTTWGAGGPPFAGAWQSVTPPEYTTPYVDRPSGYNNGQRFPFPVPPYNVGPNNPDNSINWSQYLPIGVAAFASNNRLPYAEEYDLSIQRQFGSATMLSMSYVGTNGNRLFDSNFNNSGVPSVCLGLSQLSEVTNGITCGPYGENGTYNPVSGGVITTTRAPFNGDWAGNTLYETNGFSNYNAFEVTLRRTVGRVEFMAGYTGSKSLDNASSYGVGNGNVLNPINPNITKALSAFDLTHNFVVSYSYRIPFDKLGHPNRWTEGWIISGITHLATGFPVYITEGDDNSLLGDSGVDEPIRLPGSLQINSNPRNGNPYFNTSLFTPEALGQLGNSNRMFFHGPGFNNFDLSLAKDLRLTESKSLQFRAELFNAFNHAQFGSPDGDIDDSTFGYVTSAGAARVGQVAMKLIF